MELINLEVKKDESHKSSSKKIFLLPEKVYSVQTITVGHKGVPYCAYFGVIVFDKNNKEIIRRIKWLNDFSGERRTHSIVFKTPKNTEYAYFVYRINNEVPFKSNCKITIQSLEKIALNVDETSEEDYDIPENYQIEKPDELTKEQEEQFEKNLVWIFGAPRSGTSWLGTQLLSYETKSINEPLIGTHLGLIFYRNVNMERIVDLFEREDDYFFSNKYRKIWTFYLRKLILNRIYSQVCTFEKKIIIKEPNGSLGSDIIRECLPKSKLIIVIRDGRDVLDSRISSLRENSWAVKNYHLRPWSKEKSKNLDELETLAKIWVKRMKILLKSYEKHSSSLKIKIKYENLLNDTEKELEKIYQFLEIDISRKQIQEISRNFNFNNIPEDQKGEREIVRSANPGKWKLTFTEEEKKILNKIMNKTLKELSYSVD